VNRPAQAIAVVAWIVVACGSGSTPAPSGPATAGSDAPRPSTAASPPIATSSRTSALPPDASLVEEGGDPIVGQLGSYAWGDGGSDSPWLPGAPITVGAGEPLSVTLADGTAIASWTAVRAPASATSGAGATDAGAGSGAIGFRVDQPGRWTVAVTVSFAGGGSATWYWQLEVT
jgi:hypothetical protein